MDNERTPGALGSNAELSLAERLRQGWPYRGADARILCEEAAAELERLQAENFALAAGQCVNVTADEGGRPQCKQIERLRADLRWIAGMTTQTPGLSEGQLGRLLGSIQQCAERALKA